MNNFLQLIADAIKNGGDPAQIIQQMAMRNPQIAQASRMIQGKSPQQLQQMAINMCREQGTTPEAILQSLGLR